MSHVNLLSVESPQPVESSNERYSSESSEQGADKFASLVERELDQGRRGNNDQRSSYESGKKRQTNDVERDANLRKGRATDNNSQNTDEKSQRIRQDRDSVDNTKAEQSHTKDVTDSEQQASNTETSGDKFDEQSEKDAKKEGQDAHFEDKVEQKANEAKRNESQVLLNLLAASGDMLKAETSKQNVLDNENLDALSEEEIKQLTQQKLQASKGEKILAQVQDALVENKQASGKTIGESVDKNQTSEDVEQKSALLKTKSSSKDVVDESNRVDSLLNNKATNKENHSSDQHLAKTTNMAKELQGLASNTEDQRQLMKNQAAKHIQSAVEQGAPSELAKMTAELNAQTNSSSFDLENTPLNESLKSSPEVFLTKGADSTDSKLTLAEASGHHKTLPVDPIIKESAVLPMVSNVKAEDESSFKNTVISHQSFLKDTAAKEGSQHSTSQFSGEGQAGKDETAKQLNIKDLTGNNSENAEEEAIAKQFAQQNAAQQNIKSTIEETLARASTHSLTQQVSTQQELERIDAKANEQLVEQLANRVVKDNIQTQKTQLAVETIAIYKKDFANEVKEKVMMMVNQKLQRVDIQLDPPELGNMHVRVNLQNEQASVSFMVQNQQAKEALEQHIGKLKDMLSESGVDVGDANIEQQNSSDNNEQHASSSNGKGGESGADVDQLSMQNVNMVKASAVGVDFYA